MATDLAATLVDGQNPPEGGRRARPHALHGGFRCSDGRWVLIFMPDPHWWPRFCAAVQRPEWADDPRFASYAGCARDMAELTVLMDEIFVTRTHEEWGRLVDEEQFIRHPARPWRSSRPTAGRGRRHLSDHRSLQRRDLPHRRGPGARRRSRHRPSGPAPRVGEHTNGVLAELALTAEELTALAAAGVFGGRS
jgi:crotonobetainyl-CoA:carnitine CoA-transferase CaiB-like acyl-CoA transferase